MIGACAEMLVDTEPEMIKAEISYFKTRKSERKKFNNTPVPTSDSA